jgi:uncharacterized protein (TIGR03437 family)
MPSRRMIVAAKFAVVLAIPVVLWAFSSGPDAHKTGVPGTGEQTCGQVLCHVGTAVNGGGGNVRITSPAGNSYLPGQRQMLTITITDSAARVYGFQVTARLASDRNQQAGNFTGADGMRVICAGTSPNDAGRDRSGGACPDDSPIEFIQHRAPFNRNTIEIEWAPPTRISGDVEIYVAANAADGDGTSSNDRIYTSSLTLSPGAGGKPAVFEGGVINAAQYGAQAGVAAGTWIEIYGNNLATTTREWAGSDFNGNNAPTTLEGVSVTFGDKPAFIRFVSPGQINVQVPDIGTGPHQMVITNANGTSDSFTVTATAVLPGLLAPFTVENRRYIAAYQGSTVVGSPQFNAVKPGDVVTLYGIGFGSVNPNVAPGRVASDLNTLVSPVTIRVGDMVAQPSYRGLGPGFVGLYQFNITVPALPDGDHRVTVDLGGVGTGQEIYLRVRR